MLHPAHVTFWSRAVECQSEPLTAQSIVDKMGAQYASASSYQDTGVVMEETRNAKNSFLPIAVIGYLALVRRRGTVTD